MGNDTIQFLRDHNMYPAEERNSKTLDELLAKEKEFRDELNKETYYAENLFSERGIWNPEKIDILREAINYLAAEIKIKRRYFRSAYGKNRFGPIPK